MLSLSCDRALGYVTSQHPVFVLQRETVSSFSGIGLIQILLNFGCLRKDVFTMIAIFHHSKCYYQYAWISMCFMLEIVFFFSAHVHLFLVYYFVQIHEPNIFIISLNFC